jgi:4-amino-4-deoxy-L-arabinose transferase-like glycosyltransferase
MKRQTLYALLFLILIGAFIRFYAIGLQTMNFDEEFTIMFAHPTLSSWYIFLTALTSDYTPPLHYLAVHLSLLIFGVSAEALRYPSAVAGVLTIPVAYLIGNEYKDELFGLIGAGFITTLYPMVYYSDFGRAYAFGILFVGLASWFFFRILKGDTHADIWFALSALGALWSHLYTAIPIGLMVLYLLWNRKTYYGLLILIIGSAPLTNLMLGGLLGRGSAISVYGATYIQYFTITPFDLYGHAAIAFIPIIIYAVWKWRKDQTVQLFAAISLITLGITLSLLKVMAIVPHYLVYIPILLLIPTVLPFYGTVKKGLEGYFPLYVIMTLITVLNLTQIWLFITIQRL